MDINSINTNIRTTENHNENRRNRQFLRHENKEDVFITSRAKEKSFIKNVINRITSFFTRNSGINNNEEFIEPYDTIEEDIEQKTEMAKFFESPDYEEKIKKATVGKYQKSLLNILSTKTMKKETRKSLVQSDLTEEEFLSGIKKLSKSTMKAALNNPSQYINYTQDAMYQSFFVDSYDKFNGNMEKISYSYMEYYFEIYMKELINALKYVDTDTLNQMMDKRSTSFSIMLNSINNLTKENGALLKDLIGKVKEGDASKKIKLCQIVDIFQSNDFDMNVLKNLNKKGEIDEKALNEVFKKAVIKMSNKDSENIKTDFNEEYFHLIFSRFPVLCNGAPLIEDDFKNLIKAATEGNFEEYILDESNEYGAANKKTENAFIQNGLNYKSWLKPAIAPMEFNLGNKKMTLKTWDRNPFEDIFLGNKTRCCTAIRTGANSSAMPLFIMNTAFNVIEMFDEKGNTKGMARIYMVKDENNTPSVVIDSIELTDIRQISDKEKEICAENIFKYVKQFGDKIANRPVNVYYVTQDSKIPIKDMGKTVFLKTEFLGGISSEKIYTNTNSSGRWGNLEGFNHSHYLKAN